MNRGASPAGQTFSRFWFNDRHDLGVHHFRYPRDDFEAIPHSHPEYTFVLCLRNRIDLEVGSRSLQLAPGHIALIHPAEVHRGCFGDNREPGEGMAVVIASRAMHRLAEAFGIRPESQHHTIRLSPSSPFCSSVEALGYANEILDEWRVARPGRSLAVESLLLRMIVHMLRDHFEMMPEAGPGLAEPELPGWQMGLALEYMNSTAKADFRLAELCQRVGSSESRLVRLFTRSAGCLPHHAFDRVLACKAVRMLRAGRAVKDVAYALGFRSDSHFCVVFRRIMCRPPGELASDEGAT
ncbi:MAG: AraC family transcriptional regulator [Acidobacteria bacterium]|nr:AraC family transcriptional regulator [Acidobacteriota bacterium]